MARTKKLSQDEISQIVVLGREGRSYSDIGRQYKISRQTVSRWVQRDQENEGLATPKPKKRSGRPRKLSNTSIRHLKRLISVNPSQSARELRVINPEMLSTVSERTIQRRLQIDCNMPSRRPAFKPLLTKKMKAKRIAFCKKYEGWTTEQWSKVMFSDESMFKTIASRPKHVRRPPGSNRYDSKYTIKTVKHSDSVMVWGCFSAFGRGGLYFLPENKTMNSEHYIECLNGHLLRMFEIHQSEFFLQDGAPCHTSKLTKKWLADNDIPLMDWPGNSPDLNPIENLWNVMKNKVAKKDTSSIPKLKTAILDVWTQDFTTSYLENLTNSMPKRLNDVLKCKGDPTKY